MAEVIRYEAHWGIPNAGPSVSVFHLSGSAAQPAVQTAVDEIKNYFYDLRGDLPNEVSVGFSPFYSVLNVESGQLVGTGSVTQPENITGLGTGGWAAGSGARSLWQTDVVRNGRKVYGTTFIVPLAGATYENNGFLTQGVRERIGTAATKLLTMVNPHAPLMVYSRPIPGRPGAVTQAIRTSTPATVATLRRRKY